MRARLAVPPKKRRCGRGAIASNNSLRRLRAACTTVKHQVVNVVSKSAVHPDDNERVDGTLGHGQEVECEVDVLDPFYIHNAFVNVHVNEVAMVRKPADCECYHDHDEHSYYL
jgi:hypothetical protein